MLNTAILRSRCKRCNCSPSRCCKWQMLYAETYSQPPCAPDPTFNIVGWNSSYRAAYSSRADAGGEQQVARILTFQPSRARDWVWNGLLLFRLRLTALNTAAQTFPRLTNYIRQQLAQLPQVTLLQRMATDFEGGARSLDVSFSPLCNIFPTLTILCA